MIPWDVVRALLVAVALMLPLPAVLKRKDEKLTWAKAILVGSWLLAISLVLIGDVPSRLLYWFDRSHEDLSAAIPLLGKIMERPLLGTIPGYQVVADIVANSVQGIFFVALAAGAYFWGEKHRKEGKFKS
jgi:hypothetical protein